ncbi:MAG: hypothetical protein ACRD6X_09215 [Pyrinomonadaceae bacterium]
MEKAKKPETEIQSENSKRKLLRKLVLTANEIVTYESGLSVGVWNLSRLIGWLAQSDVVVDLPVLKEYEDQVRSTPSGKERLNCSREALQRYDEKLLAINAAFHDRILDACFEIRERFGTLDNTRVRQSE